MEISPCKHVQVPITRSVMVQYADLQTIAERRAPAKLTLQICRNLYSSYFCWGRSRWQCPAAFPSLWASVYRTTAMVAPAFKLFVSYKTIPSVDVLFTHHS
jgi:hypothetical protein